MPQIPLPKDRGVQAAHWLRSQGYGARHGIIHSTAHKAARNCEFAYYLRYRLGIRTSTFDSDALSIGSYFHAFLQDALFPTLPDVQSPAATTFFEKRRISITELAPKFSVGSDALATILSNEENRFNQAAIYFRNAWDLKPIPSNYTPLASEIPFYIKDASSFLPAVSPVAGIFDGLLYDQKRNEIWIFDAKTTATSVNIRIRSTPFDFQTLIYRAVASHLIDIGAIQSRYNLPADTTFGGFIYWIVRKPTIRILKRTITKDGYDAAIAEYEVRCHDWYRAQNEFESKSSEWVEDPPVNLSYTRWPTDYPILTKEFKRELHFVDAICCRRAWPDNFPRNAAYLNFCPSEGRFGNALPALTPFYITSPTQWPDLISQHFLIQHRDYSLDTAFTFA